MIVRCAVALAVVALLAAVGQWRSGKPAASLDEVQVTALHWVGKGVAQEPRRDDDEWEVDVVRPDGSLVEVTIGDRLELRETDEELAPGGSTASDQVTGPARGRASRAALAAVGSGRVIGVEPDQAGEVEVDVMGTDDVTLEVGLGSSLQVLEIEPEDAGDE